MENIENEDLEDYLMLQLLRLTKTMKLFLQMNSEKR